jgi:muconolactone delta-isomerase
MAVYMVDRDLPRITPEGLAALQGAEIATARQLSVAGRPVRYLRSLFIPGEARCLCLFEASDEATIAELNESAGLPFTRIVAALDLTPMAESPEE